MVGSAFRDEFQDAAGGQRREPAEQHVERHVASDGQMVLEGEGEQCIGRTAAGEARPLGLVPALIGARVHVSLGSRGPNVRHGTIAVHVS